MLHFFSKTELSKLYTVSMEAIEVGIQNGDLVMENGKISVRKFRAWAKRHQVACEKKKCRICGRELPLYYFRRNKHNNTDLSCTCLECESPKSPLVPQDLFSCKSRLDSEKIALSAFSREYKLTEVETIRLYIFIARREVTRFSLHSNDLLIDKKTAEWFLVGAFEFKRCPRCGKIKRFSEYYTNSKLWHGRQHWCKECALKYGRDQRDDAKEKKQADAELDVVLKKYPHLIERLKEKVLTF